MRYIKFCDLPQVQGNKRIESYLARTDRTIYGHIGMDFRNFEIAEDSSSARYHFEVKEEHLANSDIMHGGLSYFVIDSLTAALMMARHPDHEPLTVISTVGYKAPCWLGRSYVAIVELAPEQKSPKVEEFAYQIATARGGVPVLKGPITYFPSSKELKLADVPPDIPANYRCFECEASFCRLWYVLWRRPPITAGLHGCLRCKHCIEKDLDSKGIFAGVDFNILSDEDRSEIQDLMIQGGYWIWPWPQERIMMSPAEPTRTGSWRMALAGLNDPEFEYRLEAHRWWLSLPMEAPVAA